MSLKMDMGVDRAAAETGGEQAAAETRSDFVRALFLNLIAATGTTISVILASSFAVLIYLG